MAVVSLLFGSLLLGILLPGTLDAQEETVFFLVRHAERADDGGQTSGMARDAQRVQDPHLSEAGRTRAVLLAEMLRDVDMTHIHSTDYRRTRETAEPLAQGMDLPILPYDASDLEGFAARLRDTPGRHLIVGHSNTTPELVRALGGDPGSPMEPLEYDRLYILFAESQAVHTLMLRFGEGGLLTVAVSGLASGWMVPHS